MTIADSIQQQLRLRFLDRVLASDRGRAFVLRQASRAEGTDEGRFFDELERRVDDPELVKMIRIHRDDETRHAAMFAEAADRIGPAEPAPERLDLVPRLDRALGGFFERMTAERVSVMEAYLLLQVIEERATTQFELMEPLLRRHDAHAADVVAAIARDEQRHLKYCRAIARRYAPDAATLAGTLAHYRAVEAQVFVEQGKDVMAFALERGLLDVHPLEGVAWHGLVGVMAKRQPRPLPTRFATAAA